MSLVWVDLGLNPGLPHRWRTLYSLNHYQFLSFFLSFFQCIFCLSFLFVVLSLSLSLSLMFFLSFFLSSVFLLSFYFVHPVFSCSFFLSFFLSALSFFLSFQILSFFLLSFNDLFSFLVISKWKITLKSIIIFINSPKIHVNKSHIIFFLCFFSRNCRKFNNQDFAPKFFTLMSSGKARKYRQLWGAIWLVRLTLFHRSLLTPLKKMRQLFSPQMHRNSARMLRLILSNSSM